MNIFSRIFTGLVTTSLLLISGCNNNGTASYPLTGEIWTGTFDLNSQTSNDTEMQMHGTITIAYAESTYSYTGRTNRTWYKDGAVQSAENFDIKDHGIFHRLNASISMEDNAWRSPGPVLQNSLYLYMEYNYVRNGKSLTISTTAEDNSLSMKLMSFF